jgi:hypothetical protein
MREALGRRGEAIFFVLMTEFHSDDGPIFRPQFLGDKWPYVDFIVELVVKKGTPVPYFFVQVKTTRGGYTKEEKRLKVRVSKELVCGLAYYPAPTYVVGIDEIDEQGYIVSANGENLASISSLSTAFPVNQHNREVLWQEVKGFWSAYQPFTIASKFVDRNWR